MGKKLLGASMLAMPFVALFAYSVDSFGLLKTIAAFAIALAFMVFVAIGCVLLD